MFCFKPGQAIHGVILIGFLCLHAAFAGEHSALTGAVGEKQSGIAAVYTTRLHGHITACGERYNKDALTTAHQTLPCGTLVRVTNPGNKKSVKLRVNDRGPTQEGRIVDLSSRAAKALGMSPDGFTHVNLTVVGKAKSGSTKARL